MRVVELVIELLFTVPAKITSSYWALKLVLSIPVLTKSFNVCANAATLLNGHALKVLSV